MTAEATLKATGVRLALSVQGYQFPQVDTGSDANWLVCNVGLDVHRGGTFHAERHRLTLVTVELESFTRELRVLQRDVTGQAVLEHIEEQISLTVTLKEGKGTFAGFLAAARLSDARLSFANAEIDQSFLGDAVEQLDAIVHAFPIRGSLYDN